MSSWVPIGAGVVEWDIRGMINIRTWKRTIMDTKQHQKHRTNGGIGWYNGKCPRKKKMSDPGIGIPKLPSRAFGDIG